MSTLLAEATAAILEEEQSQDVHQLPRLGGGAGGGEYPDFGILVSNHALDFDLDLVLLLLLLMVLIWSLFCSEISYYLVLIILCSILTFDWLHK